MEAKKQAAQVSKGSLAGQQQLTINSPFTEEGVQQAMKTAAAYGFTTEEGRYQAGHRYGKLTKEQADNEISLQRLLQAMVDYSAGTGRTTQEVELISLALGQVKAKGKLAGQEILQLTNAGVNVRKRFSGVGVTTAEPAKMQEKGRTPAHKAIRAISSRASRRTSAARPRRRSTPGRGWSAPWAT